MWSFKERPIKGTLYSLRRDYHYNNSPHKRRKKFYGCDIGLCNHVNCNKFEEKLFFFFTSNIAYFEIYTVQFETDCAVKMISIDKIFVVLCLKLNTRACNLLTAKVVIINNCLRWQISLQYNFSCCTIKVRNKERSRALMLSPVTFFHWIHALLLDVPRSPY